MRLFKNLKLASKLSVGFGTVIIILICTVIIDYLALLNSSHNFTYYSEITYTDTLAGNVQTNLLDSRIAFKNYMQTGESKYKTSFEESFSMMELNISELENIINDKELQRKLSFILEYKYMYKEFFENVFILKERQNDIYNDILNIKGPELEKNIVFLLDTSYENDYEELHYGASMAIQSLLGARLYILKYLQSHDTEEIQVAGTKLTELDKWLNYCMEATDDSSLKQVLNTIIEDKETYSNSVVDITLVIKESDNIINQMDEIGPKITSEAEEIQLSIIDEQDKLNNVVEKSNQETIISMFVLTLFSLFFSILVTILLVRFVIRPVKIVTNTFKEIAEGKPDFEVRLNADSTDEIGDMAKYFNMFMVKLQTIVTNDKNHSWLKTGQAELNENIRTEQNIHTLSTSIISFVAKYVNAQIGSMYIKTEKDIFILVGSYAYKRVENLTDSVRRGEGLIGQAVLEKKSILISNVPDDYIKISSGIGDAVPKNLMIVPCILNGEVKCLIELGSFNVFSDLQLEFVENISEGIAISIQSVESRLKMKELLDKTLEQTEELQVQQEELRQSNEELIEQTKALRDSEARLQVQQEELRQSNEELEEQTRALKESEVRMQHQQEELVAINEELEEKTKSLELQKNEILHARNELEDKAKDLEAASKYKSEFLANMSHELRTPLNSILVLSQILAEKKDNTPLSEKQLQFAQTIHSSGSDLLKLINDILDLSKVEAGKLEFVFEEWNIEELVQYVERSFRPIAVQKGLDFIVNIEEELPRNIVTDSLRVQQIINNLLSNAFKFTSQGTVTFTAGSSINQEDKALNVDRKEMLRITIADTGIGIPKDKQNIIFDAFKQYDGTTSRKYGGTGLGLSISKELAINLGGNIELQSEPDKGSTFTLYLPINHTIESPLENKHENKKESSKIYQVEPTKDLGVESKILKNVQDDRNDIQPKDKHIIIIEDDYNFSQILMNLAQEKGYKCILAESGNSGLELTKKYKPDAVLLDIGLPDMNGWKVIELLKMDADTKKIPVHVISGDALQNSIEDLDGIVSYLQKPVSLENLDRAFNKIASMSSKPFRRLLVVDENKEQIEEIIQFIGNKDIQIITSDNGTDALRVLKKEQIDCMILDLNLKDISGFELLKILRAENVDDLPIIIHTAKVLTPDDEIELRKYSESIIVKGSRSIERLIAEATLFLHDLDSKIEQTKIKAIKSEQEKEDSLKNKKILVVDDDMRNVFALSSVLEDKGMRVVVGRNGKEGIEKLNSYPDIDLILMDIMMPEMDGYTAMMEIRKNEKYRKIPIIALTAKAMKDDKQKCIEAGASDYLTKPLDTDKLTSLLRVWLYK